MHRPSSSQQIVKFGAVLGESASEVPAGAGAQDPPALDADEGTGQRARGPENPGAFLRTIQMKTKNVVDRRCKADGNRTRRTMKFIN